MDILKDPIWSVVIAVVTSVIASSGFWAFVQRMAEKKSGKTRLLIGLAHDRIIELGMKYLERGYITEDEYSDLNEYLYLPYKEAGGNGTAEIMMGKVRQLEMRRKSS